MVEQQNIEKLPGSKARVILKVSGDETAKQYQSIIQKYAKSIEVKGFRKGHVPKSILEQRYGRELKGEAFSQLLDHATQESFPKLNPAPLPYAQPYLGSLDNSEEPSAEDEKKLLESFVPGQEISLPIIYDIFPELPEITLDGIKIEAASVELDDAAVTAELDKMREQQAVMMEKKAEAASENDLVSIHFGILEEGQEEPEEKDLLRSIVRMGEDDAHGFHAHMAGLKTGDVKVLEEHSFPDVETVEEQFRGKTAKVWLKVLSIRSKQLPDLDDDFAQDLDEKYETLEDLKKDVVHRLQHDAEHVAENYQLLQVYRKWLDTVSFEMPRAMIAYQTQSMLNEMKQQTGGDDNMMMMYLAMMHEGDYKKGLSEMQKQAVWSNFVELVRDQYLKAQNWEASDEDVQAEIAHIAQHQNMSAEDFIAKNKERKSELEDYAKRQALENKLSKELISAASSGKAKGIALEDIRTKISELEVECRNLATEKFSDFDLFASVE